MKKITQNHDIGLLILRVSLGTMMLLHGLHKLFYGIGPIESMVVAAGMPAFFAWGVYIGEVVAPLAIILGFRTRLAAMVMAFNCLVAMMMVHSKDVFTLNEVGGWGIELLGLYLFGALALIFTGGGKYSICIGKCSRRR